MKRRIFIMLASGSLFGTLAWQPASAQIPTDVLERTITVIGSDNEFTEVSQEETDTSPGARNELSDVISSGELDQLRGSLLGGLLDNLDVGGLGLLDLNGGLLHGLGLENVLSNASVELGDLTHILNLNLGGILRGL